MILSTFKVKWWMKAALEEMKSHLHQGSFPCIFIKSHNLINDIKFNRRIQELHRGGDSMLATEISSIKCYVSAMLAILDQTGAVEHQHEYEDPQPAGRLSGVAAVKAFSIFDD